MNLSYQELNKRIVDTALKGEKEFVCSDCGVEFGNKDSSDDLKTYKGNCSMCDEFGFVFDSKAFF